MRDEREADIIRRGVLQAEEILEAANMPQLHVMVPPAVNRAASSHLMAPSPSNSAKVQNPSDLP